MKGIALLLLCAAAAAQASSSCSPDSVGDLIPHRNCDQFYMCFFGSQTELHCADGLLFNPEAKVCDWPANVDCGNRIIPNRKLDVQKNLKKDGRSLSPAEICAAEDSEGLIFDHEYCDKYYKCNHGKPVTMPCPPNLLWYNPFCYWAAQVDCGDRIRPDGFNSGNQDAEKVPDNVSGGNSDPSQAPEICAAEDSDGILVAHENCNQFYKCFDGQPVALNCPETLVFNPEKEYCDWSSNVECGNRIIPDDISNGNPNEDKGPENVSEGNSDPSQAPAICAAEDSDGVLIAHENCNQFYKCLGGQPVAMNCPENLVYNPKREYCDWSWEVDCGNRIIPDDISSGKSNEDKSPENVSGGNSDPSQAPEICAAEDSDGVLVAHENCNQFYKCLGGQPVALNCPENLVYNPEREYCDWSWEVDCGNRILPDEIISENSNEDKGPENVSGGNSDPSQAPEICAAEDSDGILVAHENCNQFYKCFDGQPVAMDCPENLFYNPGKEYCDWSSNVDCSNRIKP